MAIRDYGAPDNTVQQVSQGGMFLPRDVYGLGLRFDPKRLPGTSGQGPVYDVVSGSYVQQGDGRPYTGTLPGGGWAVSGKWSATPPPGVGAAVPPIDDKPKLMTTIEQPGVTNFVDEQRKAQPAAAQEAKTAFEKYRQDFAATQAQARATAPRAYDTSETAKQIQTATGDFKTAGQAAMARTDEAIKNFEQRQKDLVAQDRAEAAAYNTRVGAAARATALDAVARANRGTNANLVATGRTQDSGALRGRRADIYARHMLPVELQLERERYGIESGITGKEHALETDYLGNEQNQARFNVALEDQFRGNTVAAAQYIQDLNLRTRAMSQDEAFRFLTVENEIPFLSQRLRAGEISIAQALAALERSATNYTYTQPFNPDTIPPTIERGVSINQPGRTYNYPTEPSGGGSRPEDPYRSPPWAGPVNRGQYLRPDLRVGRGSPERYYTSRGLPNPYNQSSWYQQNNLPVPAELQPNREYREPLDFSSAWAHQRPEDLAEVERMRRQYE